MELVGCYCPRTREELGDVLHRLVYYSVKTSRYFNWFYLPILDKNSLIRKPSLEVFVPLKNCSFVISSEYVELANNFKVVKVKVVEIASVHIHPSWHLFVFINDLLKYPLNVIPSYTI